MPSQPTRRRFLGQSAGALGILALSTRAPLLADDPAPSADSLARRAVAFLRSRQSADGSWSPQAGPGITGIAVTALLRSKLVTPEEPVVTKGLAYVERFINPKGGVAEGPQSNYATTIALMAFQEANVKGRYDSTIKAGQSYLKGLQWDETEGRDKKDPFYGGAGYGSKSRPDMSNTSFFIEALRDTGLPADDENLKKAMLFVSRCQNLKSEFNDQPWADKVNDGGFIYSTYKGGESMAGPPGPDGALRSYASMTYAGLKSMIYAGLTPEDPRVKAALKYIQANYSLDENPGMGQAGLYYYYQTFAKALSLIGKPTLTDAKGAVHDWRADLVAALARRQGKNGEWVNPADRFLEGDPNLVTSYGLLALAYSRPKR
jgi:squalene-hopene/tetraprenyl-beta-curcumene cyclase